LRSRVVGSPTASGVCRYLNPLEECRHGIQFDIDGLKRVCPRGQTNLARREAEALNTQRPNACRRLHAKLAAGAAAHPKDNLLRGIQESYDSTRERLVILPLANHAAQLSRLSFPWRCAPEKQQQRQARPTMFTLAAARGPVITGIDCQVHESISGDYHWIRRNPYPE
jgi:hypothetical protein